MSEGWRCPGCGKCYAPWAGECTTCGKPGFASSDNLAFDFGTCQCQHPSVVWLTDGKRCAACWKPLPSVDPPGWSLTSSTAGST
jgi:hypothetical protein